MDAAGGGYSAFDGYALTRWAPDRARSEHGFWLYIRDIESGALWSAGHAPVRAAAARYAVRLEPGSATIEREDDGIASRLQIAVARDADAELRRLTVTNRSDRPRRLDVTSYAEIVLHPPAADAAHPAFAKLFVQTEHVPDHDALVAWRRPRSRHDRSLWAAHRIVVHGDAAAIAAHETDRARFLGRGRTAAAPAALACDAPLSGTVGAVLDPIFALRVALELEPGEERVLTAVLAAGSDRTSAIAPLERFTAVAEIDAAFGAAIAASLDEAAAALALPDAWLSQVDVAPDEDLVEFDVDSLPPSVGASSNHPTAPPRIRGDVDAEAEVRGSAPHHPSTRPSGSSHEETAAAALLFFNGYGGFTADGSEYVIHLVPGEGGLRRPPLPWVNVIANPNAGVIVSESGAIHSWAANSRENRLTPWSNDPVSDPHGEAIYVRDEETGRFWSPTPGPVPSGSAYEVRHGFGYSRFLHTSDGLDQETTVFVPRTDAVRVVRVRIDNPGATPRTLSLFGYHHLVLGSMPATTREHIVTEHDTGSGAILARNQERGEFSGRVAFAAVVGTDSGERFQTADRIAFLGEDGGVEAPALIAAGGQLDGTVGARLDPCAVLQLRVTVAPGETVACAFLLGEADGADAARACLARYATLDDVNRAHDEVVRSWHALLSGVRIETPAPALDLMVNGWLAYQNLSCRMWGRSAFYQSGGAFGFRDQLQDSSALLYLDPAIPRAQILHHAAHQFVAGDVLHWWHPPTAKGIRTRFSDDLLWLPYIASFYVRSTGDRSLLDETARFVDARLLEPDEDEVFLVPERTDEAATVYEHCCRAIDRSLTAGAHGLPLMGVGDWNDGMNRVGREGRGESVWLGFFLYDILGDFIPLCIERGETDRVQQYERYRSRLYDALNDAGWDGAWYRRAYYDDGTPLGSAASDECRIDALAQAWAVLSGVAPEERAARALRAMEEQLVSDDERIIRLLTPAFDRTPHDPGYIRGYLPGVRENGGQYTHAALWAVRALAEHGDSERAAPLLAMLSPVSHARTPEEVGVYRTEPYVIAADVYGVEPHVGRGGWTWYTGSAGWMYRVALESIVGITLDGGRVLRLRPCIPAAWPGFRVELRLPDDTRYRIVVERDGDAATIADVDGVPLAVSDGAVLVPLRRDGGEHEVTVLLGVDVGPRYRPRPPSSAPPFEPMTSE